MPVETPGHRRCTSSPWSYRSGIVGAGASFRRYSGGVADPIARQAFVAGRDPGESGRALGDRLGGPGLRVAFVFCDRRLDPAVLVGVQRELTAPVGGWSAPRGLGSRGAG